MLRNALKQSGRAVGAVSSSGRVVVVSNPPTSHAFVPYRSRLYDALSSTCAEKLGCCSFALRGVERIEG